MKGHFWSSRKYAEVISDRLFFKDEPVRVALINGSLRRYHFMEETKKPSAVWDDLQYLGEGEVYSIDGVLQMEERKKTLADVTLPTHCACGQLLERTEDLERHVERGCWKEAD